MEFEPSPNVTRGLFDHLVGAYALGRGGLHGEDHWLRVLRNGREVAAETGANLRVVELFALLHDSKRENEDYDPKHGHRAAEHARSLRGEWFDADDREMDLLLEACRYHADGRVHGDPTVGTCWDADRLDLPRVGILPDPRRLCTEYAKRREVIDAACERAWRNG